MAPTSNTLIMASFNISKLSTKAKLFQEFCQREEVRVKTIQDSRFSVETCKIPATLIVFHIQALLCAVRFGSPAATPTQIMNSSKTVPVQYCPRVGTAPVCQLELHSPIMRWEWVPHQPILMRKAAAAICQNSRNLPDKFMSALSGKLREKLLPLKLCNSSYSQNRSAVLLRRNTAGKSRLK